MISALFHDQPNRPCWTSLSLPALLMGLLACGGNDGPAPISSNPPGAPTILVPATGTTGFQVTASIQGVAAVETD